MDHHKEPVRPTHVEDVPVAKLDEDFLRVSRESSDDKDNPLNWPTWLKVYIVILVAIISFNVQFSSALINPGLVSMSEALGVTIQQCSYCTTVYVLFSGVWPLFYVPLANSYGRRLMYVACMALAPIGGVVSAAAPTYGGIIVGRVLNGIGSSVPLGIGAATICDIFRQHERGRYMGIYTVSVTNGPHLAPIAGGYISQRLGWQWCFWIPAITQGFLWVLLIFTLPETLYSIEDDNKLKDLSYGKKLVFYGKVLDRPIRLRDFTISLRMVKYIAVVLPAIYYGTCNTYGSILFAVTGAPISEEIFKFNLHQTGLFMGIPLTVGCFIGEASAGWVSDMFSNLHARKHGGHRKAESRLGLAPLCACICIGTATYGYCIENKRPWIDAAITMAISGFGTQVSATMVYTYCTDGYKAQAGEISVVLNLFKSLLAFPIGFYALPFADRSGWTASFSALAGVNAGFLLLMALLAIIGEPIRRAQGLPRDHQDL